MLRGVSTEAAILKLEAWCVCVCVRVCGFASMLSCVFSIAFPMPADCVGTAWATTALVRDTRLPVSGS